MSDRRLLAVVTAMLLVGSPSHAQQTAPLEDLYELEELIVGKNCLALFSFVLARPYLLEGDDALATELSYFVDDVQQGNVDCFGANTFASGPPGTNGPNVAVSANSIDQTFQSAIY